MTVSGPPDATIIEVRFPVGSKGRIAGYRLSRLVALLRRRRLQVEDDVVQIVIGQFAKRFVHSLRHRPDDDAHTRRGAGFQILEKLRVGVFANALELVRRDVRRIPFIDRAALQPVRDRGVAEEEIAIMAFAAMLEALHEIGTTIDLRRLIRIRLEHAIFEEHQIPADQRGAHIEREWHQIRFGRRMHRRQGEQIGLDGEGIVTRDLRVPRERHDRVEMLAVHADTFVEHANELIVGDLANSGVVVGRDVWRRELAERRVHVQAAGEGLAVRGRVASFAVAGGRQVFAVSDQSSVRCVGVFYRRKGGGEAGQHGGRE
jgi:hypothetical protein